VFELQRLREEHESAVYDFERTNREYFTAWVSDRGDDFFENFSVHYRELLAEQDTGKYAFHVLAGERGVIVGRFNLYDIDDGTADVGYRVAQAASGRGVATEGLRGLCHIAREAWGLRTLRAAVSLENVASQHVLEKADFVAVGAASVGGRDGTSYELDLTDTTRVPRIHH
jgi:ribosomal-protein-alanine N-acetyltransferase